MHIETYLSRINQQVFLLPDLQRLVQLHRAHVFHIPFENLDIHLGKPIQLSLPALYNKVVEQGRGGYCYELNALFNWLLGQLGYQSHIIAAQIVNNNQPGPPLDHMAITVKLGSNWLLDAGYGDLFLNPIEIIPGLVQTDGVNRFMITAREDDCCSLMMATKADHFEEKYRFSLKPVALEDFEEQNQWKQTSPDSHFVKNLICTLPVADGRKTIFNRKFLQRNGNKRSAATLDSHEVLMECLTNEFGIDIGTRQRQSAEFADCSF